MKAIYRILFLALTGLMIVQTGFAQETGKQRPNCNNNGGVYAAHIEWIIGTIRSGCTRGIGFRCGTHGWLICGDHTILVWKNGLLVRDFDPNRVGDANAEFDLKEQTVTFSFLKELPDEKEDDHNVFTVDEDVVIEMLNPIYLDEKPLQGLVIKKGEYKITYENSKYGEVTFNADIKL